MRAVAKQTCGLSREPQKFSVRLRPSLLQAAPLPLEQMSDVQRWQPLAAAEQADPERRKARWQRSSSAMQPMSTIGKSGRPHHAALRRMVMDHHF